MNLSQLAERFDNARKTGNGYSAQCNCHDAQRVILERQQVADAEGEEAVIHSARRGTAKPAHNLDANG